MVRAGRLEEETDGLGSLSAMPPVALIHVSSAAYCYAARPLDGKAVGTDTYLGSPSEQCKATP